jgi:hypothetical protein
VKIVAFNNSPELTSLIRTGSLMLTSGQLALLSVYILIRRRPDSEHTQDRVPRDGLYPMHVAAFYDSLECLLVLHRDLKVNVDILSCVYL